MALKNQSTTCTALQWNDAIKLLNHLMEIGQYRFALLFGIGFYSGLRISDILNLTWIQIINTSTIVIREKKTKKLRKIYLNDKLQELIKDVYIVFKLTKDIKADNYVFLNKFGTKPINIQYVNRMLPRFLNEINIACSNAGSHTLRKTFGKQIYESSGKSEHALIMLSELLHHSSIQSTRQYIGISEKDYQAAYMNL